MIAATRPQGTLARDLAAVLDPVELCRHSGLVPDDAQERLLRCRSGRILLNCTRQWGKSTMAALLALYVVLRARSLVLLVAPGLRQSGELFRKVAGFVEGVSDHLPIQLKSATKTSLEWTNGSRIIALPGTEATVRSYSAVSLIVLDEAARILDPLYLAVRPMLATSGGSIIALSTPFGKRGWWYDAWEHGGDTWERFTVTGDECPRIPDGFLAEERDTLPEWWYLQEYDCTFCDAIDAVFSEEIIRATFAPADLLDIELLFAADGTAFDDPSAGVEVVDDIEPLSFA